MSKPARIAIVGLGMFGQRHAATVRASDDCRLVAVADPTPAATAKAHELGVPHFIDHRQMLDAVKPDGVIVATPNALHVPVALDAIERGIPVLVEKPIAESLESGRRVVEASRRLGVPVLVGHHRRYNPMIERARALVAAGGIGRLVAVNALFLIRKPDEYFDVTWRRSAGGGPLLINAIHDIDNLRYVAGEISEVGAIAGNAVRGFEVEDSAAALLRFADGALGTLLVSDATPTPWSWELTSGEAAMYPQRQGDCYLFAGTAGSLALPSLVHWRYDGAQSWTAPLEAERLAIDMADPQPRQLAHFLRVLRREEAPRVDAADALRTLAVTLAIAESAKRGESVAVADDESAALASAQSRAGGARAASGMRSTQ
jgi:predicted dehydrogenase